MGKNEGEEEDGGRRRGETGGGGWEKRDAEEKGIKGMERQEECTACCVELSVSFVCFNFSFSQIWIKSLSGVRCHSLLLSPNYPSISPFFPLLFPLPQSSALFMRWV